MKESSLCCFEDQEVASDHELACFEKIPRHADLESSLGLHLARRMRPQKVADLAVKKKGL